MIALLALLALLVLFAPCVRFACFACSTYFLSLLCLQCLPRWGSTTDLEGLLDALEAISFERGEILVYIAAEIIERTLLFCGSEAGHARRQTDNLKNTLSYEKK